MNKIRSLLYPYNRNFSDVSNTDLFEAQNERDDVPQVNYLYIENGEMTDDDKNLAKEFLANQLEIVDDETSHAKTGGWLSMNIELCFRDTSLGKCFMSWLKENNKAHLLTQVNL